MSTGPEHYREAERLVEASPATSDGDQWLEDVRINLAAAQVHATLALAAATTLGHLRSPETAKQWRQTALGEVPDA